MSGGESGEYAGDSGYSGGESGGPSIFYISGSDAGDDGDLYDDEDGTVDLEGNYVVDSSMLPDEYDADASDLPLLESYNTRFDHPELAQSSTYRYSQPDHVPLTE